jgi:hypothetical protein
VPLDAVRVLPTDVEPAIEGLTTLFDLAPRIFELVALNAVTLLDLLVAVIATRKYFW